MLGGVLNTLGVVENDYESKKVIQQDLTQLLSESVDLQDFHDKMSKYFNEEE